MKNFNKSLILAILTSIPLITFAQENNINNYHSGDSYKVAEEKLKKTDCSENKNNCRYYAAIEYVAFSQACLYAIEYKFKEPTRQEDIIEIKNLLKNWKAIEEPNLHKAVLYDENDFKNKLTQQISDYLIKLPVDDIGIECSRIGLIKEQANPEEMSDLLKVTKNFNQWYEPIMKKKGLKYMNDNNN